MRDLQSSLAIRRHYGSQCKNRLKIAALLGVFFGLPARPVAYEKINDPVSADRLGARFAAPRGRRRAQPSAASHQPGGEPDQSDPAGLEGRTGTVPISPRDLVYALGRGFQPGERSCTRG